MNDDIYFEAPVSIIGCLLKKRPLFCGGHVYNAINSIILHAAAMTGLSLESAQIKLCFNTTDKNFIKTGREIMKYTKGEALFRMPAKMYWEIKEKSENSLLSNDDILVIAAYLAITSILGNKKYCKTTNDLWLSRMSGNTNVKTKSVADKQEKRIKRVQKTVKDENGKKKKVMVEEEFTATLSYKKVPDYPKMVEDINTRRKLDSLKNKLYTQYGIAFYGFHSRGFYVSEKLTLQQLIYEVESKKKNERPEKKTTLQKETRLALENMEKEKTTDLI